MVFKSATEVEAKCGSGSALALSNFEYLKNSGTCVPKALQERHLQAQSRPGLGFWQAGLGQGPSIGPPKEYILNEGYQRMDQLKEKLLIQRSVIYG